MTSAFSRVISPPDFACSNKCSTAFRNSLIFSLLSTISITSGRSLESSKSFVVCTLEFAPKPIIPLVTVAPDKHCFFASNTMAS